MRDDASLLTAAANGDRGAFDELVRRQTPRMYRVALRMMGDSADAEDVVQDSWVAAWRALSSYRGEASPATWLYRVVVNTATGQLRRRRATVPIDEEAERRLSDPDDPRGPESSALRAERVAAVHDALARLDPAHRAALVLREFEGLSYEQLGTVLQLSLPAVRSRLFRARNALLSQLREAP